MVSHTKKTKAEKKLEISNKPTNNLTEILDELKQLKDNIGSKTVTYTICAGTLVKTINMKSNIL